MCIRDRYKDRTQNYNPEIHEEYLITWYTLPLPHFTANLTFLGFLGLKNPQKPSFFTTHLNNPAVNTHIIVYAGRYVRNNFGHSASETERRAAAS